MRRRIALILTACMIPLGTEAYAFPDKPVSIIVPFAAGGGSDTFARVIQEGISNAKLLPEPMVVVNVPGAGSVVGMRRVAGADPDGYELLFNHIAILSSELMGNSDIGYKSFEPVAGTGKLCTIPMVRDDSNIKTLEQLVEAAKAKPDTLLAGVNMGGLNHTAGEVLEAVSDAKFRFVQIGGGANVFAALLGGHVEVGFFTGAEAVNYGKQGLRPLAILADARDPRMPDLPTARELGYDAELCTLNMWFAPKGTPRDRVAVLETAIGKAMETDFVKQKMDEFNYIPTFLTSEELEGQLQAQYSTLKKALKPE